MKDQDQTLDHIKGHFDAMYGSSYAYSRLRPLTYTWVDGVHQLEYSTSFEVVYPGDRVTLAWLN